MALALNNDNDIFVYAGKIRRVNNGAQVIQHVRSRLLMYYGEWFLDITAGVPYFEAIFVKPANLAVAESIIKETIINTPGIASLDSFYMDYVKTSRRLDITFGATTEQGDAINSTVNIQAA